MGDTVKLIIEIDEYTYKDIKRGKVYSSMRDVPQESVFAIAHGTPLDSVQEKIAKLPTYMFEVYELKSRVLQILDNIGKEESEVKPNESLIKDCCEAQGHLWADNNIFEDVEENQ